MNSNIGFSQTMLLLEHYSWLAEQHYLNNRLDLCSKVLKVLESLVSQLVEAVSGELKKFEKRLAGAI